jgi:hypothetical protein
VNHSFLVGSYSGVFNCLTATQGAACGSHRTICGHGARGTRASFLNSSRGFSAETAFAIHLRCDLFALQSATLTLIGAILAVIHVVLAAFLATSPAGFRAEAADRDGKLRVGAHEQRRRPAKHRAVTIQGDATSQHLYIVLLQTGARAISAFVRAVITSFNAVEIFFLCHKQLSCQLISASHAPESSIKEHLDSGPDREGKLVFRIGESRIRIERTPKGRKLEAQFKGRSNTAGPQPSSGSTRGC